MQTVIVKHGAQLLENKTAMMIPATTADQWRVGDTWSGFDVWKHGRQVEEVNHFGRHTTSLGETLEIQDIDSMEIVCKVQVVGIRMVISDQLTDDELRELGHGSREALAEDIGTSPRKMWYMRVAVVDSGGVDLLQ